MPRAVVWKVLWRLLAAGMFPFGTATGSKGGGLVSAASVVVWLVTAMLGANLLLRSGVLSGGPNGRLLRRRFLLLIHLGAAASGLVLWIWFFFAPTRTLGMVSVLLLLVAASHGLIMVLRWAPGFGQHAARVKPQRRSGGYFPVHAAAIHAVSAGATLTLVVLVLLRFLTL